MAMENDTYRINGIGPKRTAMLESIGVDSVKELSHRNAASLVKMISERHGRFIGMSEKQIAGWIEEAKSLQK